MLRDSDFRLNGNSDDNREETYRDRRRRRGRGFRGGTASPAQRRRRDRHVRARQYISFANCGLPYHIGGTIADRTAAPRADARGHAPPVRSRRPHPHEVMRDRPRRTSRSRSGISPAATSTTSSYDALILSPGAEPFGRRSPASTARASSPFAAGRHGRDQAGGRRQASPARRSSSAAATSAWKWPRPCASAASASPWSNWPTRSSSPPTPRWSRRSTRSCSLHGVDLRLGASSRRSREEAGQLSRRTERRRAGRRRPGRSWPSACGPRRNSPARRACDSAPRGGIVVDDHMRTSDPDIYAVGDAVEVDPPRRRLPRRVIPLAGPANRQGRIAADNIFGRDERLHEAPRARPSARSSTWPSA